MNPTERVKQEAALKRLDRFSYWTDSNFGIPFTRFRFGLSPLIGLVPVIGDFAGLVLSLYVLVEARKVKASSTVQKKMIRNMLIEFFGGLVPIFGDAFDAIFKANTRNTQLLRNYLQNQLDHRSAPRFPWGVLIWLSVLLSLLVFLTALLFIR